MEAERENADSFDPDYFPEIDEMIGKLYENIDSHGFNEWEQNFIEDMRVRIRNKNVLNPKQSQKVYDLYKKLSD